MRNIYPPHHSFSRVALPGAHEIIQEDKNKNMNKITRDCQKGGPPITASKCMIIMKICTSVTSILIRYKKPKRSKIIQSHFKAVICKLSSSALSCTVETLQNEEEIKRQHL